MGYRNTNDGLWDIPITHKIQNNYRLPQTTTALYQSQQQPTQNHQHLPRKSAQKTIKKNYSTDNQHYEH